MSAFRLFIDENSTVNAMYGVFVITALESWDLSLPRLYAYTATTSLIRPNFFYRKIWKGKLILTGDCSFFEISRTWAGFSKSVRAGKGRFPFR